MDLDLSVALQSLHGMAMGVVARLPYIVIAVVIYAAFHMAARGVRSLVHRLTDRRTRHRNAGLVLGRLAEGGIMLLGAMVALMVAIPSFQPGQLIQVLGIGGVAIGFAFRDILQNFLAGILILLTEPFRIGDQIVIGAYEGTVEDIETRATFIRTYDGRRVVIPNSTLFTDSVTVNTAFGRRRLEYDFAIGDGEDFERKRRVILRAAETVPGVLREPAPEVRLVGLSGDGVTLRARWWIEPPASRDVVDSRDGVLAAVKQALLRDRQSERRQAA
ncbi:mechanosensitive ion channel family protein [Roseomonas sp. NAR14]|uniref:Small-conductance mechanosensitive channel n=1 Tax=Roseomonas acroporae TaxID=2937791 RepID=A0A9X2BWM2_9PROT|nr:mechanosensitive ion channel family protein [Roseomonas acroporae]MCK8784035.1 mechanosensitive ion channel family protein [Roseomonas acroporae]